jgi:hypothetical protein
MAAFPHHPPKSLKAMSHLLVRQKAHTSIETEVSRLGVQRYVSNFFALPIEQLQSPSTDALSLKSRVYRLEENHRDPPIISLPEQ